MTAYADTGFLCSLYAPDAHSARAVARMRHQALPLPWTWLHELELRNALRLRVFRREITAAQGDLSLNAYLGDLASRIFISAAPELSDVMREAERLSVLYTHKLGTRSLDLLHVALALVLGCDTLLSFDRRQRALARATALKVPSL